MLEIGIDSFAAINKENYQEKEHPGEKAMDELLERIVACDQLGFDVFGIGEHHRKEFLDSSPCVILAAAAARTKKIRLTSCCCLKCRGPCKAFKPMQPLILSQREELSLYLEEVLFRSFPPFLVLT